MIVACTSCPAQYSVPDAKIRGRKVRVTCKHCGAGFIVDASDEPVREQLKLDSLGAHLPRGGSEPPEDATRTMPRPADFSVHDEPTVIGQIPAAALEAERRYAQRTMPPPTPETSEALPSVVSGASSEPPKRALPHDLPEAPLDVTGIASPQAKRASQGSLPPPSMDTGLAPTLTRASRPSLAPQPAAELKTMLSRDVELEAAHARARSMPWILAGLVLVLLVTLWLTTR